MAKLKDSQSLNDLKGEYDQIWDHLLLHEEDEAKKLIHGFAEQVDLDYVKSHEVREFKDYLKTPYPYVAMFVGICLPVIAFLLFLLLP